MQRNRPRLAAAFAVVALGGAGLSGPAMGQDKIFVWTDNGPDQVEIVDYH